MSSEDLEIIDTTTGNNPEQVDTVLDEDDNVIAGTPPIIAPEELVSLCTSSCLGVEKTRFQG